MPTDNPNTLLVLLMVAGAYATVWAVETPAPHHMAVWWAS
jgi:hypothetical protein